MSKRRSHFLFGQSRKTKTARRAASPRIGRGFESLEARLALSADPILTVVSDQVVNEGTQLNITNLGAFTDIVEGGPGGGAAGLVPTAYAPLGISTGAFDPAANVIFNTDTLTISGGFTGVGTTVTKNVGFGDYEIAVFAFTDFELDFGRTITATGSRPFALLSLSDLTVAGTIDVSAFNGDLDDFNGERIAGPGGGNGGFGSNLPVFNPGSAAAGAPSNSVGFPNNSGGPGGGAGGGYGGNGGRAEGQQSSLGGPAGQAYGALATGIQGGGGGATAGGGLFTGSGYLAGGGGGGGGIELGAVGTLEVSAGGKILADGGDGAAGINAVDVGSGGGGAGGGILLHAANVNQFGQLSANGGNGGVGAEKSGGGGGGGRIMIVNSPSGTFNNTGGTQSAAGGIAWLNAALGGENGQAAQSSSPILEVFDYVIKWGDGSLDVTGAATIDVVGMNVGDAVAGSFDGSHTYADDGVYLVTVTINDNNGGSDTLTFSVTVSNVAPTADAGGPYLTFDDLPITLNGSAIDVAGTLDPLSFAWDFDGDNVFGETGVGAVNGDEVGASPLFDPVGLSGTVTVALRVSDDDGGISDEVTATIEVLTQGTLLIDGVLHIVGSDSANDIMLITQCGSDIKVFATFNNDNPAVFAAAAVTRIDVRTRGGHDVVVTTSNVLETMTIDGGDGNDLLVGGGGENFILGGAGRDTLIGGAAADVLWGGDGDDDLMGRGGNDVLVGGAGRDIMDGGVGRDLLIGGANEDRLHGGTDDDILIGGFTSYDANLIALDAIMTIWGSAASFESRVSSLGGLLVPELTVFDDNAADHVIGAAGRDLAFASTSNFDSVKDTISLSSSQDVLVTLN